MSKKNLGHRVRYSMMKVRANTWAALFLMKGFSGWELSSCAGRRQSQEKEKKEKEKEKEEPIRRRRGGGAWRWYLRLEPLHQRLSDQLLLSCTQTSVSATHTGRR